MERNIFKPVLVLLLTVGLASNLCAQHAPPLESYEIAGPASPMIALADLQPTQPSETIPSPEIPHDGAIHPLPAVDTTPQFREKSYLEIDLSQLIVETLRHSQRIQSMSITPLVRETQIAQADAAFDFQAFLSGKWDDISVPTGSILDAGGADRLSDEKWNSTFGVRRRSRLGGLVELSQQLGLQDNSSSFFVPENQATSLLTMSLSQPLLKNGGRYVNESVVLVAQHNKNVSDLEFMTQLQDHLLSVVQLYWTLDLQRAIDAQKMQDLDQTRAILAELQSRESVDALRSQIERAKAAVAVRIAEAMRAHASAGNAESELRAMVNSPEWPPQNVVELVPTEIACSNSCDLPTKIALQTALANRPEITAGLERIQTACIRLGVSKNQLLPSLALVLEGYVKGLSGNFDTGLAYERQFSTGAPSYSAGIVFEVPLGNRYAKAQHRQRCLELFQLRSDLEAMTAQISAEVDIALRNLNVSQSQLAARQQAVVATKAQINYLQDRWHHLPGDEQSTPFLLEDLLDALGRLSQEQQRLLETHTACAIAAAELQRAMGTLVAHQQLASAGARSSRLAQKINDQTHHK